MIHLLPLDKTLDFRIYIHSTHGRKIKTLSSISYFFTSPFPKLPSTPTQFQLKFKVQGEKEAK